MLSSFVGKIQRGFSHFVARRRNSELRSCLSNNNEGIEAVVPDDVMEGHLAVIAIKGEETQRFIVDLGFLTEPAFLGLLERAQEEYGFKHKGALAIPCWPQELQQIIDHRRTKNTFTPEILCHS